LITAVIKHKQQVLGGRLGLSAPASAAALYRAR
jgi:hypothetical protein